MSTQTFAEHNAAERGSLVVRLMTAADVDAVDALRITSYARATWFTLTDRERIRCARDAAGTQVTVVCDGAAVVATIAQTRVADREGAEALLELEAPVAPPDFPALVISRAATAEGYSGLRLNHLLRWYTLRAATTDGIRAILGGHARGTPNLRVMEDLGYEFLAVTASNMSLVHVNTEHVMSYLPADRFSLAFTRLTPMIEAARAASRWEGDALSFVPVAHATR